MTLDRKIQHMIDALTVALDEVKYINEFESKKKIEGDKFYTWSGFANDHRQPSGTIVRESLRHVARLASIAASECTYTSFNNKLTRDEPERNIGD